MISFMQTKRGFTLIEMIVSIGLFTIVLFIASSAFLAVVNADRKSRATRLAMDNLTVAMEDMTRRLKTGYDYNCGGTVGDTGTSDCLSGPLSLISFTDQDGLRTAYRVSGKQILRQVEVGGPELPVTSSEISINTLTFDVQGSSKTDNIQPYVKIFINGSTAGGVLSSSFKLQTMVTQRLYDI